MLKLLIDTNYNGLPIEQVRVITKQILEGLNFLHTECRVMHADIKPENILLELTSSEIEELVIYFNYCNYQFLVQNVKY